MWAESSKIQISRNKEFHFSDSLDRENRVFPKLDHSGRSGRNVMRQLWGWMIKM